jgi:hypothetical protein
VTVLPPVTCELQPGGPGGEWLSISLWEPGKRRLWLHFRQTTAGLECAWSDNEMPTDSLCWNPIGDAAVGIVIAEFAENYSGSRSSHAELSSPPCSLPGMD